MARNPSRQPKTQEKEAVTESKKPTMTAGPFDLDTVRNLVNLMKEHELWEIELADGGRSIKLKRGGGGGAFSSDFGPNVYFRPDIRAFTC